jgi:hypothetical protein
MQSIDFLEHGGGHFHVRHHGKLIALPDPRAKHYQWVLAALHVKHAPGTPGDLKEWQRRLVFERWCAAWDLPDFNNARRLAYLVDNYRAPIASDLATYAHMDLGDLWRARRWTLLLDVLDRLPAHSWYAATVSMDEDHARMMAESIASRPAEKGESKGPSLTTWTPEVAALTNVLDAVRGVQHAVIAAQHGKKAGEPPKPSPRPVTPLERALKHAENERRQQAHQSLVARMLPHKAQGHKG